MFFFLISKTHLLPDENAQYVGGYKGWFFGGERVGAKKKTLQKPARFQTKSFRHPSPLKDFTQVKTPFFPPPPLPQRSKHQADEKISSSVEKPTASFATNTAASACIRFLCLDAAQCRDIRPSGPVQRVLIGPAPSERFRDPRSGPSEVDPARRRIGQRESAGRARFGGFEPVFDRCKLCFEPTTRTLATRQTKNEPDKNTRRTGDLQTLASLGCRVEGPPN